MSKRNNNAANAEAESANSNPVSHSGGSLPPYLTAALRIPSSYPLGASRLDTGAFLNGGDSTGINRPTPGYMVLDYIPTFGVSTSVTSALNRAMYNEFNIIRSEISGNRPYEPADHMLYRICVDSMRELYAYVQRIYGLLRVYSASNLYRPDMALKAMGMDVNNWKNNAAALYQWLLNHKNALIPFPTVPLGSIHGRRDVYNSAIFTDGEGESVQGYIFNQKYFYSYEKVDEAKGATLKAFPDTFEEFVTMWDEMYTALMNSSDVYIIAADIRRAFGDRVVTDLPDTPVDYALPYVKFDPVLTSIMNACVLPGIYGEHLQKFKVVDNPGNGLVCNPTFIPTTQQGDTYAPVMGIAKLSHLNMVSAQPSEVEYLNATRLKPVVQLNGFMGLAAGSYSVEAMGTEILTGCRMVGFSEDGGTWTYDISSGIYFIDNGLNDLTGRFPSVFGMGMFSLIALANFDWHPPVVIAAVNDTSKAVSVSATFEDVQNYIPISDAQLRVIHEANILSEFGV